MYEVRHYPVAMPQADIDLKRCRSRLTSLLKEAFERDLGAKYCVKSVINQNSQAK